MHMIRHHFELIYLQNGESFLQLNDRAGNTLSNCGFLNKGTTGIPRSYASIALHLPESFCSRYLFQYYMIDEGSVVVMGESALMIIGQLLHNNIFSPGDKPL